MDTKDNETSSIFLETLGIDDEEMETIVNKIIKDDSINKYIEAVLLYNKEGKVLRLNARAKQLLRDHNYPDSLSSLLRAMDIQLEASSFFLGNQFIVRCTDISINNNQFSLFVYAEFSNLFKLIDINSLKKLISVLDILYQEKKEYDFMLDALYDLVTITDNKGNIIKTNSNIEDKFGISKKNIVGKNIGDLVRKGVITNSVTQEVIKHKKTTTMTQETQQKRRLTVTGHPMFNAKGEIFRIFNISRDITEVSTLQNKLSETEDLIIEYEKQLNMFRQKINNPNLLVTSSIKMEETLQIIKNIVDVDSTILIEGETGVGKGVLANKIHTTSSRRDAPFVKINCGAIPENLMESELFGYERGSFTGANRYGKKGLVSAADGGTLFLDEVSDLPLNLQVKVLDLIQNKTFYPVGSVKQISVDVRIIAATNTNLRECVDKGLFREDLYYRLAVIPIRVPPLRERIDEISILIHQFLEIFSVKYNTPKNISRDCIKALEAYPWPGNIRELENLIERLVLTSPEKLITVEDLPTYIVKSQDNSNNSTPPIEIKIKRLVPLKTAYRLIESELLSKAFSIYNNNEAVAEILGVHRTTISRKKSGNKQ